MMTEPTTRMVAAGLSARLLRARRWILYLAVGCLVTIYFWTPAALRDIVANLEWETTLSSSLCMLAGLQAMWANNAGFRVPATVRYGDRRDMKAGRT